ncbi:MAG TPA: cytochrome c [Candidatus Paceibacterota bacterium]|nr:cytochrome c [Verrucomicrobiota bacterium]HRY50982.1 cytochrome c [Candidatus Paceibacterota bacterium]HSA01465.1 cytochrome c [Candidatus Paceibacterota bacterium]
MKTRSLDSFPWVLVILGLAITFPPMSRGQTGPPRKAADLYGYYCKGCHGATGKGDTKLGQKLGVPDFTSVKIQEKMADDQMFKAIKDGIKKESVERMKPYGDKLNEEQIKGLVAYIRTLKTP